MEQIYDRVAGCDVHRDEVAVCVRTPGPRGGVHKAKARFKTTTAGLAEMGNWLAERAIALVAMEATGVYWKPVYYALEDRFKLWLCNAHHGGASDPTVVACSDEARHRHRRRLYVCPALETRTAEKAAMHRCECPPSCWCRRPILSAFRWVTPIGHR